MSEKQVSAKLTIAESVERSTKNTACEIKEHCSKKKIASSEIPMEKSKEIAIEVTKKHEAQKAKSTKDDKAGKAIPAKAPEKSAVNIKIASSEIPMEKSKEIAIEVTKKHEAQKAKSTKDDKAGKAIPAKAPEKSAVNIKIASSEIPMEKSKEIAIEVTEKHEAQKAKSTKDDKAGKAIPAKAPEKSAVNIKIASSEIPMEKSKEIAIEVTEKHEAQKVKATKDDKAGKAIPAKAPEKIAVNIKLAEAPEVTKVRETLKEEYPKDIQDVKLEKFEIPKVTKMQETLKTESTKNVKDDKSAIPTKDPEESHVKNTKPAEASEVIIVHETPKEESPKYIKDTKLKFFADASELSEVLKTLTEESHVKNTKPAEASEVITVHETPKEEFPKDIKDIKLKFSADAFELSEVLKSLTESTKDVKDDSSEISLQDSEESNVKDIKPAEDENKTNKIPVLRKDLLNPWDVGVRKIWRPMSAPNLNERPLVLAIHLAPSLPIELFEVFAEIIEVITKKPVVLLYESRFGRPVAKDITDIAILPAADDWNDGVLLPVSFVFEHHLNKNNSPHVFVDILVANDSAPHVEDVMDLRGYRCAIPNRCDKICATSLLFNCLYTKGENPAFFGNILDGNSQLDVLQMVANKQAEVGVLEAPVIRCQKLAVIGAEFLHILASLGPLPPYRIMINKAQVNTLAKELATYLLNINQHKEWMDRLSTFGIVGFAENSTDFYNLDEKSIPTSVPYY